MAANEIRQMQAGPAMDALIDTEVFGWHWPDDRCRVCGAPLFVTSAQGCTVDSCSLRPAPDIPAAEQHPAYSTDLAMAWQAKDGMLRQLSKEWTGDRKPRVVRFVLDQAHMNGVTDIEYWARLERLDRPRGKIHVFVSGDTAPLAVCRAILLAADAMRRAVK